MTEETVGTTAAAAATATATTAEASAEASAFGAAGTESVWDAVVVGGGAAGLSAALTLGRARRRVLVIDAGRPRNASADAVHVFLTRDGTPPADLLRLGRIDVEKFGGVIREGRVVSAERRADVDARFALALEDGSVVLARRLVITTGVVDRLPEVPGLREQWGRGVIHCPYCHGWEVRDEAIGVLGTGPRAVHQALLFSQWSNDVTLLLHEAAEPTEVEAEQLAARGVRTVRGRVTRIRSSAETRVLTGVEVEGGEVVPLRAVTVASRIEAADDLLPSLGATVGEHPSGAGTWVESDDMARAAEGVWVAGNVANPMAQVITAAAGGVAAAAALNADLMAEDLARAVERHRALDKQP